MRQQVILSFGNFFSSAHFFLIIYILAPYLATFMPAQSTGLVISLGALLTLCIFPYMPQLVARYGAQTLAIALASLEAFFLLWLSISPAPIAAVLFVALACAASPLIAYQLDLLLEATVRDEGSTGRVRTAFLTAGNAALLITPLLTGMLLDGGDMYGRVFLAAAVSLVPFILLMVLEPLPHGNPPRLNNVKEACLCIVNDADLRGIASAMAVLQFFYHLAPLYVPLYLHTVLGLPWSELGWIFAIMLIPFVVVEYPAGILADKVLGDRLLLIIGFIVMGLSFASILFIQASTPLYVILLILVVTRLGAALVEAMVEGHFFRRVSEEDANTVSVFRMMRPAGALIAPIVGTLLLTSFSYAFFFAATGIAVVVLGVASGLAIRDHR